MNCEYFGKCGSCTLHDLDYEAQKSFKLQEIKKLFEPFGVEGLEWHSSRPVHYRTRAEFVIWHDKEQISYAMHKSDKSGKLPINKCLKVDEKIAALMPKLLAYIQNNPTLREELFGVEFLSSVSDILVSLLYHKRLDGLWEGEAKECGERLSVKIIGRSKGVKIALNGDFVSETLSVEGKSYHYKIYEGSFSQPNRGVNEQMISWVSKQVLLSKRRDLLELYCGHGNFTIPLSLCFRSVLATEISKASINAARDNAALNAASNITFVRLSAEELMEAIAGKREFFRLKDIELSLYDFTHILIDPPRAGLEPKSREFLRRFDNIIYISCNPHTLKSDLDELCKSHKIRSFALFDQFPYTTHIESGVILEKLNLNDCKI